jgi:hypothetical protein
MAVDHPSQLANVLMNPVDRAPAWPPTLGNEAFPHRSGVGQRVKIVISTRSAQIAFGWVSSSPGGDYVSDAG